MDAIRAWVAKVPATREDFRAGTWPRVATISAMQEVEDNLSGRQYPLTCINVELQVWAAEPGLVTCPVSFLDCIPAGVTNAQYRGKAGGQDVGVGRVTE